MNKITKPVLVSMSLKDVEQVKKMRELGFDLSKFVRFCLRNPEIQKKYEEYLNVGLIHEP